MSRYVYTPKERAPNMLTKGVQHKVIDDKVTAFLAAGGHITECKQGASGDDRFGPIESERVKARREQHRSMLRARSYRQQQKRQQKKGIEVGAIATVLDRGV